MRSRFSAYVLELVEYLKLTWHPQTRPNSLSLSASPKWRRLEVLSTGEDGDMGYVHFKAFYGAGQSWGCLEECSEFCRLEQGWVYVEGKVSDGSLTVGRNEPCPCGSGRKFKRCCGA